MGQIDLRFLQLFRVSQRRAGFIAWLYEQCLSWESRTSKSTYTFFCHLEVGGPLLIPLPIAITDPKSIKFKFACILLLTRKHNHSDGFQHFGMSSHSKIEQYWAIAKDTLGEGIGDVSSAHTSDTISTDDNTFKSLLEDELYAVRTVCSALASRRNALSSFACRIPSDILAHIFSFTRNTMKTIRSENHRGHEYIRARAAKGKRDLAWTTVTHICRYWRHAALAHPALWTDIVVDAGRAWADEMLSRAKYANISLVMSSPPFSGTLDFFPSADWTREVVSRHMSHISALTLHGSYRDVRTLMAEMTSPVPALEKLIIKPTRVVTMVVNPRPPAIIHLPAEFLAKDAPVLSHLDIRGCTVPWTSPVLSNLTSFAVHFGNGPDLAPGNHGFVDRSYNQFRPSLEEFLDLLQQVRGLEELRLTRCLPSSAGSSRAHRVVVLEHLACFYVVDNVEEITAALSHISIAPTSFLSITCLSASEDIDGQPLFATLPWVSDHMSSRATQCSSQPVALFFRLQEEYRSLRVTAWDCAKFDSAAHLSSKRPKGAPPILQLDFSWVGATTHKPSYTAAITRILTALPVENVRYLAVSSKYDIWDQHSWRDVFGSTLPWVRVLRIVGPVANSFPDALVQSIPIPNADSPDAGTFFFPVLNILSLRGVDLDAGWGGDLTDDEDDDQ
ncbi:hypothetical protein OF83DRAFT_193004 [Amylostereum chailletii]|nr:hypothetical protein OF83DRAFT_193004 [Amylostereum chailletii]